MNKDYKEKWLEALRSGNYVQGCGQLKSYNNEFCCLGVLCDVVSKNNEIFKWDGIKFDGIYGYLSHNIMNIVGISFNEQQYLSDMNESIKQKRTFKDIAKYIEENL